MKKCEKVLGACLVSGVAAMAIPPAASGEAHSDERVIHGLDVAWSRSLHDKDLDGVMSNYADDAVLLLPSAPAVEGKAPIREWFSQRFARPGYSASFAPTQIVVSSSGDMAYELGTFRVTVHDDRGRQVTRSGKHLVTWRKRGGRWQVSAESLNHDQAGPPAPGAGCPR
jgi:ketosteroid isomerase-like protein